MDSVAAESGRVHRPLESTVKTVTPRLPIEYSLLLTATLCLLAGGAVMVYSASSSSVLSGGSGGTSDLIRFVVYGGIGLVVLRFAARVGLDVVRRLTGPLLGLAFLLLIAVKLPGIGHSTLGQHAQRWIGLGPVQFEPSELMKLALVLYSAHVLSSGRPGARNLRTALKRVALVGGAACLLVGSQPDLGTTLVIAFALVAIVLTAGIPIKVLALTAVLGVGAVMLFTLAVPYAGARLTSFLDPWAHATQSGYQSVQSQIAVGSGGLLGRGPGQSVQKDFYLPEAPTDFILAVIGEELGVLGVCGVVFLYGMIAYAGLRTARRAVGRYAKLLATGLTSLILCQGILNIFVVLGLAPLTGVPLPFISYAPTNLCVMLAAVGLLLNISRPGARRLKVVEAPERETPADRDRRRRDRRARRAGAGGRGRATG
jgi:cell division protein FtsW